MKHLMKYLTIGACILPFFAMADCEETECDLGELLQTCRALEQNPQIKPFTSKIICHGSETFWEPTSTASNPLATSEVAFGQVTMKGDKYSSKETGLQAAGTPFEAECHDYQEMTGEYAPTQKTINNCDELEEIYVMGQASFCHEFLKEEKVPMVAIQPTGKTHKECGEPQPEPEPEPSPEPGPEPEPEPGPEPGPIGPVGGKFQRILKSSGVGQWFEFQISEMAQTGLLSRLGLKVGDRFQAVNGKQFIETQSFIAELERVLAEKNSMQVRVYIALADSYRELKYKP